MSDLIAIALFKYFLFRCSKQERDLRQKRLLIEEYRIKQGEVNEILQSKDAKIVNLSCYLLHMYVLYATFFQT